MGTRENHYLVQSNLLYNFLHFFFNFFVGLFIHRIKNRTYVDIVTKIINDFSFIFILFNQLCFNKEKYEHFSEGVE